MSSTDDEAGDAWQSREKRPIHSSTPDKDLRRKTGISEENISPGYKRPKQTGSPEKKREAAPSCSRRVFGDFDSDSDNEGQVVGFQDVDRPVLPADCLSRASNNGERDERDSGTEEVVDLTAASDYSDTDDEASHFEVEGAPVFSKQVMSNVEIGEILSGLKTLENPDTQICWQVPPLCPGKGAWSFVVNVEVVNVKDLSYDEHGSWGTPSGRKVHFKIKGDHLEKVGKQDRKPGDREEWDFCLSYNRYTHPENPEKFKKAIYRGVRADGSLMNLALIQYDASCNPTKIYSQKPHGNAKKTAKPFQRVKPTTRDLMFRQSSISVPRKVLTEVRKKVGGVGAFLTDLPRDSAQARNIAKKNPNSKRSNAAGKPTANDFAALEAMMGVPGSFVKYYHASSANKDTETQHIEVFLTDSRGIALLKDFGLKTSKDKRPVKVDMTYKCVNAMYLTPVQMRHPYFQHKDNYREPIVPIGFLVSNYRLESSYQFLAECLVKAADLKSDDEVHAWVSDGEGPLIAGFKSQPQFAAATHLRCEQHLKENIETQLRKLGASKDVSESKFLKAEDPGNLPPADLYLMHKAKWVYTHPTRGIPTMAPQATEYFYCAKYSCILRRFPYFWLGYLKIDRYTAGVLSQDQAYDEELRKQFGVKLSEVEVAD